MAPWIFPVDFPRRGAASPRSLRSLPWPRGFRVPWLGKSHGKAGGEMGYHMKMQTKPMVYRKSMGNLWESMEIYGMIIG